MNTKLLMTTSAITLGTAGIALSFMPHEVLNFLNNANASALDPLVLQILGALYFAFAMTNWTAKANLIGGIYGRPVAIGNVAHYIIGSLALLKGYANAQSNSVLVIAIAYTVFAIMFTIVFFTHPVKDNTAQGSI